MSVSRKENRFIVQRSEKPGYWTCTDTQELIVCTFKEHAFNDDQNFTTLEDFDPANYMKLAQLLREMGDWLKEHHYEIIF